MHLLRNLDSFKIYIIILILSFGITIDIIINFYFINLIFYLFIHLLMIYIGIYYFRKILYLIFFICGIVLDLSLLNEFGPHLLTFMILILSLNLIQKTLLKLSSQRILLFIVFVLFISLFIEKMISYLLYNYSFDLQNYLQIIFISFFIAYPAFYLFYKIDNFK